MLSGRSRHLDIMKIWQKKPGRLTEKAFLKMLELLGERSASWKSHQESPPRPIVTAFINSVFLGQRPKEKIGLRNVRELQILALALDGITKGDISSAAGVLVQNFGEVGGRWQVGSGKTFEADPDRRGTAELQGRVQGGNPLREVGAAREKEGGVTSLA